MSLSNTDCQSGLFPIARNRYMTRKEDWQGAWFGPGGGRFKSSLSDHYFQSLAIDFWFAALRAEGDFEAAKASKINKEIFR